MSANISNTPIFYHRDYTNDIPLNDPLETSWIPSADRIAVVSLPFLSLYKPFQPPLSVFLGSLRVWNMANLPPAESSLEQASQYAHQALAVGALATTFFAYPLSMLLITTQDTILDITALVKQIEEGKVEEAALTTLKISSNLLYLTFLYYGGLELSITSLAMQTLVLSLSSLSEFKEGHWLEGFATMILAAIRAKEGLSQYEELKRRQEIEKAIKEIPVGELHEQWNFPSDHLPVGVEVNGVRVVSWNVLNNEYMDWVTTKDSQGLKGSLISKLDHPTDLPGVTARDAYVADMVRSMTSSNQVIALQECGAPFIQHLEQQMPQGWQMVKSFNTQKTDQTIILYDTNHLHYEADRSKTSLSAYPNSTVSKPVQKAVFSTIPSDSKKTENLCIINAHIPGDPKQPARQDFANFVAQEHHPDQITLALGDNNFERDKMLTAYKNTSLFKKKFFTNIFKDLYSSIFGQQENSYSLHSPYKTNIDPYTKESKSIDHIFIAGKHTSRDLKPGEVVQGYQLESTVQLLNTAVK